MSVVSSCRRWAPLCCMVATFVVANSTLAKAPKPGPRTRARSALPRPHNHTIPHQHINRHRPNSWHAIRIHSRGWGTGPRVRRVPRPNGVRVIGTAPVVVKEATPPDLAVTNIERVPVVTGEATSWIVRATLRNISPRGLSLPGRISFFELYKDGRLIGRLEFSGLASGAQLSLTAAALASQALYEARIIHFDATGRRISVPDLDPANDSLQVVL